MCFSSPDIVAALRSFLGISDLPFFIMGLSCYISAPLYFKSKLVLGPFIVKLLLALFRYFVKGLGDSSKPAEDISSELI